MAAPFGNEPREDRTGAWSAERATHDDAVTAFVPVWARGRDARYHARESASHTLRDGIRADIRGLRLATDGNGRMTAEDLSGRRSAEQ